MKRLDLMDGIWTLTSAVEMEGARHSIVRRADDVSLTAIGTVCPSPAGDIGPSCFAFAREKGPSRQSTGAPRLGYMHR
jgi:hypothetical protein